MSRLPTLTAVTAAVVVLLAGCSATDGPSGPEVAVEWARAVAADDDEAACELAARFRLDGDSDAAFADSWEDWDAELREYCAETLVGGSALPPSDEVREELAALTVEDVEVMGEPEAGVTSYRLGDVPLSVDTVEHDGRAYVVWRSSAP